MSETSTVGAQSSRIASASFVLRRRPHLDAAQLQHPARDLLRIRLVVHDEHADPVQHARRKAGARRPFGGARRRGRGRKAHAERCPLPRPVALDRDGAAVQLDQMSHDREPEAEAAMTPRRGRVGLPEALEHVGQQLRTDAPAVVADLDRDEPALAHDVHLDPAARFSELDRVGDQVPHHLLQAVRITRHVRLRRREPQLQPHTLRVGGRTHRFDRRLDNRPQLGWTHRESQLPRDDARDVEEIVDQLHQAAATALDGIERAALLVGIETAGADHRRPREDRHERGAQLVRRHRQKLVLRVARGLRVAARRPLAGVRRLTLALRPPPLGHVLHDHDEMIRLAEWSGKCAYGDAGVNRRTVASEQLALATQPPAARRRAHR